MARIQNVNYEAMPAQAQQMRRLGQELNDEVIKAYKSIADMHTEWYGKRYNELVKVFNNIIPQVNELLDLVVGDIPFAIETVANNYSQADRGYKATNAANVAPNRIQNIALSNDVGMKFVSSSVETIRTTVSNNFVNATTKMNNIETEYNKIEWESEAAEAFRVKFRKLKTEIVKSFENIDNEFKRLMNQAIQDIQTAESSNTVQ